MKNLVSVENNFKNVNLLDVFVKNNNNIQVISDNDFSKVYNDIKDKLTALFDNIAIDLIDNDKIADFDDFKMLYGGFNADELKTLLKTSEGHINELKRAPRDNTMYHAGEINFIAIYEFYIRGIETKKIVSPIKLKDLYQSIKNKKSYNESYEIFEGFTISNDKSTMIIKSIDMVGKTYALHVEFRNIENNDLIATRQLGSQDVVRLLGSKYNVNAKAFKVRYDKSNDITNLDI